MNIRYIIRLPGFDVEGDANGPFLSALSAAVFSTNNLRLNGIEPRIVKQFEKKNLMSNNIYWEDEGTSLACSPASETYWSM